MTVADFAFIAAAGITLLGAFLAVALKNVFYNALSLILCLFGVACLFIFLNSEFLAVMEVIIYIGAIAVAIIFAIMLSRPPMLRHDEPVRAGRLLAGLAVAAALFFGVFKTLRSTAWPTGPAAMEGYDLASIGRAFLTTAVLPFEAVSLVLLVAIVGALVLAADTKGNR
jgi:NADH-quinone oxidoreductase subunit J